MKLVWGDEVRGWAGKRLLPAGALGAAGALDGRAAGLDDVLTGPAALVAALRGLAG